MWLAGWFADTPAVQVSPPYDQFVQYGALGAFCLILVWFAKTAYKREIERSDRLEDEVKRLNSLIQDKQVPALEAATRAVEDAKEFMEEERARISREADIAREARFLARDQGRGGGP